MSTQPLRRNRDFVLLQSGQVLSTFGSGVSTIAYPLLVLAVTGSAAKAGYVGAAQFAPLLFFNLPAGLLADRIDRRRLMIAGDVVSAAAVGTLGVLIVTHNAPYWAIVVVAFVDATASVFFRAGMSGAFRSVVPLTQLADASSVTQARAAMVRLGAPPVGGALFAVGRAIPFLVDAVSYVFSTASLLCMRTRFQEQRAKDETPLRAQLAEGLSFLSHVPFLRTTMLMIAASNLSTTGVQLSVIILAKRAGLSSTTIGLFVALVGATTLLGSLASSFFRRVFPLHTIVLSEFWAALVYLPFFVWPSPYVLATAFALQAFWFPNTDSAVNAYWYALTPDRLVGRVMSVSSTLRVLAVPLGPVAAGLLLTHTSARTTIGIFTAWTLAAAVVGTFASSIRHAPPLDEVTTASTAPAAAR
jgi:predicted MFS family arabinose efflux permease